MSIRKGRIVIRRFYEQTLITIKIGKFRPKHHTFYRELPVFGRKTMFAAAKSSNRAVFREPLKTQMGFLEVPRILSRQDAEKRGGRRVVVRSIFTKTVPDVSVKILKWGVI